MCYGCLDKITMYCGEILSMYMYNCNISNENLIYDHGNTLNNKEIITM